ncbi:MAG: universal stress protein [Geminicoccaceae bacterium]|nr:universal stress protein [Geminicoccaceae bacterium]MCB9944054.1 universal stress protein [Geminicoccaceae bacterium]
MFNTIMVPVDLRHVSALGKALTAAAAVAKAEGATVTYVGVTSPEPGELGHSPKEFGEKLDMFAAEQAKAHGHRAKAHVIVANDPAIDIDAKLARAVEEIDADLVVMATHLPRVTDYIWSSHGSYLANHARTSVFLVRG